MEKEIVEKMTDKQLGIYLASGIKGKVYKTALKIYLSRKMQE